MTGDRRIIAADDDPARPMALYPYRYDLDNAGATVDGTDYEG